MSLEIKLEGLEKVQAKLAALKDPKKFSQTIEKGLRHLKGKIAVYPPSTGANSPGEHPSRWYERGFGERWTLAKGGIGGKKRSKTLGKRWSTKVINDFSGELTNDADYGPFVQGGDDQAMFHQENGWTTDEQVIESERETILDLLRQAIREILGRSY